MIRGEMRVDTGVQWRIRIAAYDPRDYLSGHYLTYRFEWNEAGNDGWDPDCLCLGRNAGSTTYPIVMKVECGATKDCDAFVRKKDAQGPGKFFIPEGRASSLQEALNRKAADLAIMIHPDGSFAVKEMYVDGLPLAP
jgi:hypothetical protein